MATYVKANGNEKKTTITGREFKGGIHATEYLSVEIASPYFETRDEAIAYASQFPKCVRAREFSLSGYQGRGGSSVWFVRIHAEHEKTAGNAKNETGLRRISRAIEILKANGVEVVAYAEGFSSDLSPAILAEMFLGC